MLKYIFKDSNVFLNIYKNLIINGIINYKERNKTYYDKKSQTTVV